MQGMLRDTAASVASGATPMIALTLLAVVPVRPALEARYVVPLLGMLLGNSIGGLAVGLAAILEELHSGGGQGRARRSGGRRPAQGRPHLWVHRWCAGEWPTWWTLSWVGNGRGRWPARPRVRGARWYRMPPRRVTCGMRCASPT